MHLAGDVVTDGSQAEAKGRLSRWPVAACNPAGQSRSRRAAQRSHRLVPAYRGRGR